MKMLPKLGVCLLLLGIIALVACEKEPINSNQNTIAQTQIYKGISLKDDMLVFENEASMEMLTEISLKNQTEMEQNLKAQFPNFKSNKMAYDELINDTDTEKIDEKFVQAHSNIISLVVENGEKYVRKTNESSFLSSICNENGFFQIGNTVYKVTRDNVFEYDAVSKVEKKKHVIERNISEDREVCIAKESEYGGSTGAAACNGDNNKRKLRTVIYFTNYVAYSEFGVYTENLRRNGIGYWAQSSSFGTLSMSGSYRMERWSFLNQAMLCSVYPSSANATPALNGKIVEVVGHKCWSCCTYWSIPANTINVSASASSACGTSHLLTF